MNLLSLVIFVAIIHYNPYGRQYREDLSIAGALKDIKEIGHVVWRNLPLKLVECAIADIIAFGICYNIETFIQNLSSM